MFRHHRPRPVWVSVPIVSVLLLTAAHLASPALARASTVRNACEPIPKLERTTFPDRPELNTRFLPLVPGTRLVLEGFVVEDDGLRHPHRIETTVTDVTKVVDGVRTIVVLDKDFEDGRLQESEIYFQAQDRDDTEWLLGEYPEEYDKGRLTGAPDTWLAGVRGAKAGIAMLAHPRVGTPTYRQGLATRIGFEDCATVVHTGQHTCVPTGCYDDVLVTDEFAANDPAGGHQRKYYAPGVGNIRVEPIGGTGAETQELRSRTKVCGDALAKAREEALKQDSRAYHVARHVYDDTPHARRTLHVGGC
jgi:hypothetical protein